MTRARSSGDGSFYVVVPAVMGVGRPTGLGVVMGSGSSGVRLSDGRRRWHA